jgi:hypothetical protein
MMNLTSVPVSRILRRLENHARSLWSGLFSGVPSIVRQLEGESPFDNLMEVKS